MLFYLIFLDKLEIAEGMTSDDLAKIVSQLRSEINAMKLNQPIQDFEMRNVEGFDDNHPQNNSAIPSNLAPPTAISSLPEQINTTSFCHISPLPHVGPSVAPVPPPDNAQQYIPHSSNNQPPKLPIVNDMLEVKSIHEAFSLSDVLVSMVYFCAPSPY